MLQAAPRRYYGMPAAIAVEDTRDMASQALHECKEVGSEVDQQGVAGGDRGGRTVIPIRHQRVGG